MGRISRARIFHPAESTKLNTEGLFCLLSHRMRYNGLAGG
nr:MAG TPA: hypothetical protein [Caudoviricetes sp.]